jgi:hypothetical protein
MAWSESSHRKQRYSIRNKCTSRRQQYQRNPHRDHPHIYLKDDFIYNKTSVIRHEVTGKSYLWGFKHKQQAFRLCKQAGIEIYRQVQLPQAVVICHIFKESH